MPVASELHSLGEVARSVRFSVKPKGDEGWSEIGVPGSTTWNESTQKLQTGRNPDSENASDLFANVEIVTRIDACSVEVKFIGRSKPLIFNTPKPKLQRIFGAYCWNLMERRSITEGLISSRPTRGPKKGENVSHYRKSWEHLLSIIFKLFFFCIQYFR